MTLALPSTHDEAWRWSDLSALPALAEAPAKVAPHDIEAHWIGDGPRLLFVDGRLDESRSRPGPIRIGQTVATASRSL